MVCYATGDGSLPLALQSLFTVKTAQASTPNTLNRRAARLRHVLHYLINNNAGLSDDYTLTLAKACVKGEFREAQNWAASGGKKATFWLQQNAGGTLYNSGEPLRTY